MIIQCSTYTSFQNTRKRLNSLNVPFSMSLQNLTIELKK